MNVSLFKHIDKRIMILLHQQKIEKRKKCIPSFMNFDNLKIARTKEIERETAKERHNEKERGQKNVCEGLERERERERETVKDLSLYGFYTIMVSIGPKTNISFSLMDVARILLTDKGRSLEGQGRQSNEEGGG